MNNDSFTLEQQSYLQGFAAGSGMAGARLSLPTFAATVGQPSTAKPAAEDATESPDAIRRAAQDRFLDAGRQLAPEEMAKRKLHGLDIWDELLNHARDNRFPKGTDIFLFKFLGLFYVAPAQDSFMCRLRIPGGVLTSHQLHGVAQLARQYGGGYADITTRANLQIRQIPAPHGPDLLMGLYELGIINRGAGADNVRNITASPTAGIDPRELIDTQPLARQMHHYILHHRELYDLPRKFNIAFDGGGSISVLEDTNDIGFAAVQVGPGHDVPPGVYFRMALAGITGHKDFARDSGILLLPEECIDVAAAVLRVFLEHGDRTDRKKARLKYLLDAWGLEKFMEETQRRLPKKLRRFPIEQCMPRPPLVKHTHIGVHAQTQPGKSYVGIVGSVGRLTVDQMHGLADLAQQFGSGSIRLTVWQNLILPNISQGDLPQVQSRIRELGLDYSPGGIRAGLVACTGNAGCRYAAANTKKHALQLAQYLDGRLQLDCPINIHLTGCPHSCAQHFIGDIGMLATSVAVGDDMVEGYHIYVGGGYASQRAIGRELFRDVAAADLPRRLETILRGYLAHRDANDESFDHFVRRHSIDELKTLFEKQEVTA